MKNATLGLFLFVIIFLLSFRFFLNIDCNIGHNWDWSFPSLKIFFKNLNSFSLFSWNNLNLGTINNITIIFLIPNLIFSIIGRIVGIKIFLFLLFFLIFLISFLGFKKLLDFLIQNSFVNYLPSLLYSFSPFLFNDIIGGAWTMWVSYAFCPIYFLFFLKYVRTTQVKYLLLSLLISIFIIISLQNFVLIKLFLLLYLTYEVIFVIKNEEFKNIIKKLFIFLILIILINVYWFLPFIYSFSDFARDVILQDEGIPAFDPITKSTQSIWNIFNLGGYLDRNMYLYSIPLVLRDIFQFTVALVWLAVLVYLLEEKNKNRIQRFLFWLFALLILMIIVKGGNYPLSKFTLWLYRSFPFIRLYRGPQHLMFIPAFIIPILIAFSLSYFYTRYKMIVLMPFALIIIIWISGWWYNDDLGHRALLALKKDHVDFYRLPPELIRYYEDSQKNKIDYRTFFLPAVFSPRYLKTEYQNSAQGIQPEYMYLDKSTFTSESNKFAETVEISFCKETGFDYIKYLSLFAVKNIVLRSDIYPHFTASAKCWDNNFVRAKLDSSLFLDKFLTGKYASAYEIKDDYFLPHFYIPKNIIYSPNDIEALPEIVGLPGYQIRSAIYLEPEIDRNTIEINRNKVETDKNMSASETKYAASPRNKEILEGADEVVVEGKLENQVDEKYFDKLENYKNSVPFPYVRWEPGSWEWKLARLKEKYEEWKVRKNPEKLIDKKLFYAGKRISEAGKFQINSKSQILNFEDYSLAELWKREMNETIEEIKKLRNLEIKGWEEQVIKLRAYWERHKEEIEEGYRDIGLEKYRNWEGVFGELDEEIKGLEKRFDLENLEYSLKIPREGEYKVYLEIPNSNSQSPNKSQIPNYKLQIDGEEIGNELMVIDEKWLEVGKINLGGGEHKITLQLPPPENLVGGNWQKLEEEATESGEIRLVSQGFFPKGENIVFQSIKDWEPGQLYYLNFEYKTRGGSLGMSVLEDKLVYKEKKEEIKTEKILEKSLRSADNADENADKADRWERFERIVRADENARGAKVYFYSLPEPDAFSDIRFRNVNIYKIEQPKIILVSEIPNSKFQIPNKSQISNSKSQKELPRITFVKINPTKYRIKVEGAKQPYTLVFSESFHRGWYLYLKAADKAERRADEAEIVASYFDGDIKEGTHKNIFLDKNTFETWGKKPIAEDRHYLVNGYANSWCITPEDVGGKENYELIVEFWPQKLFYIGLFISGLTFIGCVAYLIYNRLNHKSQIPNPK